MQLVKVPPMQVRRRTQPPAAEDLHGRLAQLGRRTVLYFGGLNRAEHITGCDDCDPCGATRPDGRPWFCPRCPTRR